MITFFAMSSSPWGPGPQPCVQQSSRHCWPGSAGQQAESGRRGSQWSHPEPGGRGGGVACPRVLSARPRGEPCSRPAERERWVYVHVCRVTATTNMSDPTWFIDTKTTDNQDQFCRLVFLSINLSINKLDSAMIHTRKNKQWLYSLYPV